MGPVDRLVVVSDLHLAPSGPLCNFFSGGELAEFLDLEWTERTLLVLAGDTFDLLLGPPREETLSALEAPRLLEQHLSLLKKDRETRPILESWQRGARAGRRAVVLAGNHDLELFHPEAERVFRRSLGLSEGDESWRVHRGSEPLHLRVEPREVVIGHGHRPDPWNAFEPGNWPESDVDARLLPPGSLLVLRVFNAFKELRNLDGSFRYSFLDALKPEMPGVLLLLLRLDPARVRAHLPFAWEPLLDAVAKAVRRRLVGGPSLGPELSVSAPRGSESLERLALGLSESLLEALTEPEKLAPRAAVLRIEQALASTSSTPPGTLGMGSELLLLAAVHALAQGSIFFDPSSLSGHDRSIIKAQLPEGTRDRIVVSGHTHAAREHHLSDNRSYLNSGTWTDLISLPPLADREAAQDWERDLLAGRGGRIRRRTWVEIDPAGGRLRGLEASPRKLSRL